MGATDDVFGRRPQRPEHPDFWRLSEIVLANDGRMDAAPRREKERVWKETTGSVIDVPSITYMATQRAIKLLGPPTPANLAQHSAVAALYIDAFVTGAMFEQRGGKQ
jgi:hypothetical protein